MVTNTSDKEVQLKKMKQLDQLVRDEMSGRTHEDEPSDSSIKIEAVKVSRMKREENVTFQAERRVSNQLEKVDTIRAAAPSARRKSVTSKPITPSESNMLTPTTFV